MGDIIDGFISKYPIYSPDFDNILDLSPNFEITLFSAGHLGIVTLSTPGPVQ